MKMFRRANLITGTLFAMSAAILIGVVYFAFNIQVLKDWRLTLPSGPIHAGDTIVVASTYTKLRQVTGTSMRTLECEARPDVFISTPLNKVSANRSPGTTGTGVLVTIPNQIQGITTLPDTCRVCIALTYPVLPGRTVPYFKCTVDFTLLSKTAPATVSASTTQTSPSQSVPVATAPNSSVSSSDNTVAQPAQQPDTSQLPTPAVPASPSLIQRILSPISKLLGWL